MLFSSSVFLLCFLVLTMILYFVIPGRFIKLKNLILLAASLVFYGWGEPKYIAIMVFSILFNYLTALLLGKAKESGSAGAAKGALAVNVIGNLALLGVFKYLGFLSEIFISVTGSEMDPIAIALPIGISFYTFQTMSYVIDVYRGKVAAQKSLLIMATYVALFPQLIAGPIVRYSDVEAQLIERRTSSEQVSEGIRRFIIGFAKKILLANQVAVIWNEISSGDSISTAAAWLGAVCYTFQIYFDFSGYSDMAIGLGKIFGFDYLENFNYPYISKSITEFWRRWHMSLSSWFKEYVYIPLGGNRKGLPRQLVNIAIVWALTGLWHGADWNFIIWGVYYGIILIIEKMGLLRLLERIPSAVGHVYSIIIIVMGWTIFAIDDLGRLVQYFGCMFGSSGMLTDGVFAYYSATRLALLIICAVCSTPLLSKVAGKLRESLQNSSQAAWDVVETVVLMGLFALSIGFLVSGSYNPFLYFRF